MNANGQVFHFDVDWKHGGLKLLLAINSGLLKDVQVLEIKEVNKSFHAHFASKKKRYTYHFYQGYALPQDTRYYWSIGKELDREKMQRAANIMLGKHDFTSFAASRRDGFSEDPIKTIYRMDIVGRRKKIRLMTEGSVYMYKMVRTMAGVLAEVELGKLNARKVNKLLVHKKENKSGANGSSEGIVVG